jgi:hypothetical protein
LIAVRDSSVIILQVIISEAAVIVRDGEVRTEPDGPIQVCDSTTEVTTGAPRAAAWVASQSPRLPSFIKA